MWLDVAASNNDPFHVCTNFADTVISLGGIPYVIHADRGTENVRVCARACMRACVCACVMCLQYTIKYLMQADNNDNKKCYPIFHTHQTLW